MARLGRAQPQSTRVRRRTSESRSLTAGFEQGTSGNTVATTDAGDANAWDAATVVANGTLQYDNSRAAVGSRSVKLASGATAGQATLRWITSLGGTVSDHYGRFYVYVTAVSTTADTIFCTGLNAGSVAFKIAYSQNTGLIYVTDNPATKVATTTNALATNQWVRIEYHITHSTTAGAVELKLFNTATSTTPTETISFTAGNTLAAMDNLRFGHLNSVANYGPFWMDAIVGNATAYPGPAATAVDATILVDSGPTYGSGTYGSGLYGEATANAVNTDVTVVIGQTVTVPQITATANTTTVGIVSSPTISVTAPTATANTTTVAFAISHTETVTAPTATANTTTVTPIAGAIISVTAPTATANTTTVNFVLSQSIGVDSGPTYGGTGNFGSGVFGEATATAGLTTVGFVISHVESVPAATATANTASVVISAGNTQSVSAPTATANTSTVTVSVADTEIISTATATANTTTVGFVISPTISVSAPTATANTTTVNPLVGRVVDVPTASATANTTTVAFSIGHTETVPAATATAGTTNPVVSISRVLSVPTALAVAEAVLVTVNGSDMAVIEIGFVSRVGVELSMNQSNGVELSMIASR